MGAVGVLLLLCAHFGGPFQKLIWASLPGGCGSPAPQCLGVAVWSLSRPCFGVKSTLHSSADPRLPPAWQQLPPEDVSTCTPPCASRPTSWSLFLTLLYISVSEGGVT